MKSRTKAWIVFFLIGWIVIYFVTAGKLAVYLYRIVLDTVDSIEKTIFKKGE